MNAATRLARRLPTRRSDWRLMGRTARLVLGGPGYALLALVVALAGLSLFVLSLFAELRAEAPKEQGQDEPEGDQVVVGEQPRVDVRERREQHRPEGDQPHLVGVPDRPERREHRLPVGLVVTGPVQHPDSEVEAVEDDVHRQREHHDAEPDLR